MAVSSPAATGSPALEHAAPPPGLAAAALWPLLPPARGRAGTVRGRAR